VQARKLLQEAQLGRRRDRARRSLAQGLLELSQGEWRVAEDTVTRSARDSESPLVHYLVAARAADLQGERTRCEEWLTKALDSTAGDRAPVLITQAEILLRHKQSQAALTVLQQLEASGERNTRAVVLLARIYRQTGDWERLQQLEPRLRGARGISAATIDEIVVQIYLDRLKAAGGSLDFAKVEAAWDAAPVQRWPAANNGPRRRHCASCSIGNGTNPPCSRSVSLSPPIRSRPSTWRRSGCASTPRIPRCC
jgi:HemY protein